MPRIIKTMELLGYSPKGGVCFGIAMMGSQAIIRDQSSHFIERINFIKNASEEKIESIAGPFDREIEKELHATKVDLYAFFDELVVYQGGENVDDEFKSIVPNAQNANNVKDLAGGEKNSQYVYPKIKQNFVNLFSHHEFVDFLIKTKNHLDGHSFSILLSHSPKRHATQIGFDAKQKRWFSSNHDYVIAGKDTISDIEKVVKNIFLPYRYSDDNPYQMTVSLDILLSEKTASGKEIDLSPLKINDFNIEKLVHPFNQAALSHVITCYESASRYDEMMALFDKITSFGLSERENVQLLESKRANGLTLFHFLIIRNKADVLQAVFDKTQEMKLSAKARIVILDKKDRTFPSLLIVALQYGLEKSAQVLIHAINAIEDENARARLLGEKWMGVPALSIAIEKGYINVSFDLIHAISNLKDEKVKAWLLEAKDNQNVPALLVAIANEHTVTAKRLINAIDSMKDYRLKARLLEARSDPNTSALLFAAKKGYTEIVEMLIEALHNIEKRAKAKLLEAKRNNSAPILLRAASNEHHQILQILISAMYDIEEQQPDFFETKSITPKN